MSTTALLAADWAASVRDQLRGLPEAPVRSVAAACRLADCLELDRLPAPTVAAGCCAGVHLWVFRKGSITEGVCITVWPGIVRVEPVRGGRLGRGRCRRGYTGLGLARSALAAFRVPEQPVGRV